MLGRRVWGVGLSLALAWSVTGTGCKKKKGVERKNFDPMALVPEGASFLMNLDVAAVLGSKAYSEHQEQLEGSDLAPWLAVLRACELGPERFARVAMGANAQSQMLFVLRGKGIGQAKRWSCLSKAMAAGGDKTSAFAFTVQPQQGKGQVQTQLVPAKGQGRGLLVDENTVILSEQAWWPAVLERVAGRSKAAIETSLSSMYSQAPTKHHLWFRGRLPETARADLGRLVPNSESGLELVSGGLSFTQGISMELDAVFASAQTADTAKRELGSWLDGLRGYAPMFGLPKSVMERAQLESKATLLRFGLEIHPSEWNTLQRNLSRISAGSRDAPKIPDMYPRASENGEDWKKVEGRRK